nr:hypothetical protein [Fusobacterium necrophorum]
MDKDHITTISYFQNEGVARNEKENYVKEKQSDIKRNLLKR